MVQTVGEFHLGGFVNRFREGSLVMQVSCCCSACGWWSMGSDTRNGLCFRCCWPASHKAGLRDKRLQRYPCMHHKVGFLSVLRLSLPEQILQQHGPSSFLSISEHLAYANAMVNLQPHAAICLRLARNRMQCCSSGADTKPMSRWRTQTGRRCGPCCMPPLMV